MSEYALLLAGIAVACIAVVMYLGGGIGDVFGSAAGQLKPGTFRPPTPSPHGSRGVAEPG